MSYSSKNIVGFYNKRGTAEQWIKEGKGAIKWTRLSCRSFNANAVRLQLHALAYNLGNFLRTLATPDAIADWSPTSLREKLIKIGAKVVSHGRSVTFQVAEVGDLTAVIRGNHAENCGLAIAPDGNGNMSTPATVRAGKTTGKVRPYHHAARFFGASGPMRASFRAEPAAWLAEAAET